MLRQNRRHTGGKNQKSRYQFALADHPGHYSWPPDFAGCDDSDVSKPGGGRIGGRFRECARFCTSMSEKSMAGAAADTGTEPDSAPQIPLKTALLSPVTKMRCMAASGVPTMSTPRTSSSGRSSG